METLIAFGSEIKTLEDAGGYLKIGGYLVLFGSPEEHDATRLKDYFTRSTDFDIPASGATSTVYYHHGLNSTLKARPLGRAVLLIDDAGVWMEAELQARDEYEAKIQELVRQGKLGLNSGTASHLVERTAVKNAYGEEVHRIDRWPLGLDASLTPTPGEPRTMALSLKSLDEVASEHWDLLGESGMPPFMLGQAMLAEYVRVQAALSGVYYEVPEALTETLKSIEWEEHKHPRDERGRWTNGGGLGALHFAPHSLGFGGGQPGGTAEGGAETGQTSAREMGLLPGPLGTAFNQALSGARSTEARPKRTDNLRPQGSGIGNSMHLEMNLNIPLEGQADQLLRIKHAFATIDAVVGLGIGRLYKKQLPTYLQEMHAYGAVQFHIPTGQLLNCQLKIDSPALELTVAHESWHVIEWEMRRQLTGGERAAYDKAYGEVMNVIRQTDAYKDLAALRGQAVVSFTDPFGNQVDRVIDAHKFLDFTNDEEYMARAFSQYVARKTGNETMLSQIDYFNENWTFSKHAQWKSKDFAPVEAALDKMFQQIGMVV